MSAYRLFRGETTRAIPSRLATSPGHQPAIRPNRYTVKESRVGSVISNCTGRWPALLLHHYRACRNDIAMTYVPHA